MGAGRVIHTGLDKRQSSSEQKTTDISPKPNSSEVTQISWLDRANAEVKIEQISQHRN